MLEQCKSCIFFNKEYNELRQSGDDIIVIGKEEKTNYYCGDDIIPQNIVYDKEKCNKRIAK